MKNSRYDWQTDFLDLFDRSCERLRAGERNLDAYYAPDDLQFLESIGYRKREFFDFVEDHVDEGDPTPASALLVAAARRDYFLHIQDGKRESSAKDLTADDLPARDAELGGFRWLPRIIPKARAKLRGTLDPDLMYGCGGDRGFLQPLDIHPADFLRVVWAAGEDDDRILAYVRGAR